MSGLFTKNKPHPKSGIRYCRHCGFEMPVDSRFCRKCGTAVVVMADDPNYTNQRTYDYYDQSKTSGSAQKNSSANQTKASSSKADGKKRFTKWLAIIAVFAVSAVLVSGVDIPINIPAVLDADAELTEVAMPVSGHVFFTNEYYRPCAVEIDNNRNEAYYFKFVYPNTDKSAITFFVRPNSKVSVDMPTGNYELRYASGKTWYGTTDLFGSKTHYAKDEDLYLFEEDDYSVTVWEISFDTYENDGETLTVESISAEDF